MKKEKQETSMNLTKNQLQQVINFHLTQESGLNELFAMMVNGLMSSERQIFLAENKDPSNKGNGYRQARRSGIGSKLELSNSQGQVGYIQAGHIGAPGSTGRTGKRIVFRVIWQGLDHSPD